jgi:2-polyprenyl-6-methoxyphenol hydroxylase-like FAD-dependent oxidoreductase
VTEHFRDFADPIQQLIDATPEDRIVRSDINDRDPIERWGDGRVTLLGDAAHPMTPNLGQGACMAIEDGVVLAGRLAGASDPEAALRSYEEARRERTAKLLKQSRRVGDLGRWNNPVKVAVRNRILSMVIRGPGQKEQVEYMTFEH